MSRTAGRLLPLAIGLAVVIGLVPSAAQAPGPHSPAAPQITPMPTASTPATAATTPVESEPSTHPLAGVRIALDPGHQLGNHNFARQSGRLVPAGGFRKPCNTTGASTDGGYPEATVNFRIAALMKARLEALGARVYLTRSTNRQDRWGPCVDRRGEFGTSVGARLMVSLHADGAPPSAHGFHVIVPRLRRPWTSDIAGASLRLGKALRAGMDARGLSRSTYIGAGTALSIRSDLATLNLSDVPVAMVEIGNMRNAADARRMTSVTGRQRYADALVSGIRRFLGR